MKSFIYNLFVKKLLRAYVVLFYYVPNQNKVFLFLFLYKWHDKNMGDGGVGDHFHRFLRDFPRFCAPI